MKLSEKPVILNLHPVGRERIGIPVILPHPVSRQGDLQFLKVCRIHHGVEIYQLKNKAHREFYTGAGQF